MSNLSLLRANLDTRRVQTSEIIPVRVVGYEGQNVIVENLDCSARLRVKGGRETHATGATIQIARSLGGTGAGHQYSIVTPVPRGDGVGSTLPGESVIADLDNPNLTEPLIYTITSLDWPPNRLPLEGFSALVEFTFYYASVAPFDLWRAVRFSGGEFIEDDAVLMENPNFQGPINVSGLSTIRFDITVTPTPRLSAGEYIDIEVRRAPIE